MLKIGIFITATLFCRITGIIGWSYFDNWGISLRCGIAITLLVMAIAHWNLRSSDITYQVHPAHLRLKLFVVFTGWLECILALLIVFSFTINAAFLAIFLLLVKIPARKYALNKQFYLSNDRVRKTDYVSQVVFIFVLAIIAVLP